MQLDTKAAAKGRWRGILATYGLTETQLSGKHTECPACGGKDRFRFDDKDGNGTFYCNQCGAGNGFDLVMRLRNIGFRDALKEVAPLVSVVSAALPKAGESPEKVKARLKSIMSGATREIINPYLANRGITVGPNVWYHPRLEYWNAGRRSFHPAMLGVMQDANGESIAIHRTYLTPDGCKASVASPKKLTTPIKPLVGGAIRLFHAGENLGIAEGIETACAAFQLFGVPTWAAYSAVNLEKFVVPDGVRKLVVFSDNDASFTGQDAAFSLAKRVKASGIECEVRIPQRPGTDWADYLV